MKPSTEAKNAPSDYDVTPRALRCMMSNDPGLPHTCAITKSNVVCYRSYDFDNTKSVTVEIEKAEEAGHGKSKRRGAIIYGILLNPVLFKKVVGLQHNVRPPSKWAADTKRAVLTIFYATILKKS